MQCMLTVKGTIFTQLQLTLDVLTIFISGIVLTLALAALQGDDFDSGLFLASHFFTPMTKIPAGMPMKEKPPSGIEPLTSTLPWLRSAD